MTVRLPRVAAAPPAANKPFPLKTLARLRPALAVEVPVGGVVAGGVVAGGVAAGGVVAAAAVETELAAVR